MVDAVATDGKDKWQIFRYFLGDWTGTGSGKPGNSTVERSYRLILADQFIEMRDRSIYEPQEANPAGEIHQEIALISYDNQRSRYIMREFHVEGYVNQYVLEASDMENGTFTFVTEAIENMPPGWRARTTIEILSEDAFRETFDLSGPAKEWACFITSVLHRVK